MITEQVLIEMLETTKGSEDGVHVHAFVAGECYNVEIDLARVFVDELKVAKYIKRAPANVATAKTSAEHDASEEAKRVAALEELAAKKEAAALEELAAKKEAAAAQSIADAETKDSDDDDDDIDLSAWGDEG